MALTAFKSVRFQPASMKMIDECNTIITSYGTMRLTLRQLYYQLVTKNSIVNSERSYKNLSKLVSQARLAGEIDWDAIEDRGRRPVIPLEFNNLGERVELAIDNYRLPRWKGQEYYVEVWVEKDAISGFIGPVANKWHVPLCVNKGYSSQSAMYAAAQRILHAQGQPEQEEFDQVKAVVLYLGDHDPSGEDMVRDIEERLNMFGCGPRDRLEVQKIALTTAQVRQYKPPPNPAKFSDPRASEYMRIHGQTCWEVDALSPKVLIKVVETAVLKYLDVTKMQAVIAQEDFDKERLRVATKETK